MASPLVSSPSSINDLQQWVIHIGKTFENVDTNLPVCISQLPETLTTEKPESYVPQHIGLGPIHHFRTELYSKQEQLKLITAKRVVNNSKITSEFKKVVLEKLKKLVPQARCCYDLYFDIDDDTLAWVFTLDGLFLLDVLSEGGSAESLGDVMMLENQIPLLVLVELHNGLKSLPCNPENSVRDLIHLDSSNSKSHDAVYNAKTSVKSWGGYEIITADASDGDEITAVDASDGDYLARRIFFREFNKIQPPLLLSMPRTQLNIDSVLITTADASNGLQNLLVKFCETRSPLKFTTPITQVHLYINSRFHLLDCMYHLMVNYNCRSVIPTDPYAIQDQLPWDVSLGDVVNAVQMAGGLFPVANVILQPVLAILKLPWDKITSLVKKRGGTNPKALQIEIPSASELSRFGKIEFRAARGGICNIEFNEGNLTFCLPVLDLKSDSEVILRNLVAYEGLMFKKGTITNLDFTEYVDLMCGIVDGVKDVKLLREKNIIKGDLGDDEIVKLFNGIAKSSAKTDESKSNLQKTIAKVNNHFGNLPSVKAYRFIKKLFLASWKTFAIVLSLLSIVLMIIEGVCQVYECKGQFGLGAYATGNYQLSEI